MKSSCCLLVLLAFGPTAVAKEHTDYQNGRILQMESSSCWFARKGQQDRLPAKSWALTVSTKKTQELLCQEYTLESERFNGS